MSNLLACSLVSFLAGFLLSMLFYQRDRETTYLHLKGKTFPIVKIQNYISDGGHPISKVTYRLPSGHRVNHYFGHDEVSDYILTESEALDLRIKKLENT